MLDLIKEYAYKRVDLLKLEATEKSVSLAGTLTYLVLALFFAVFFLILFLVGIGLLIGSYIGNYGWGVLIVAGFCLLMIALTFALRKKIKNMMATKILESLDD
ncbi:phage holin family protein [Kaistella palustris]|uniref:phage holin family protein n=1 Tax=Kaistella palustris TaxID=493376 RepID=UPI00040D46A5|nr:phage holin family protein [Kaistella palustris]